MYGGDVFQVFSGPLDRVTSVPPPAPRGVRDALGPGLVVLNLRRAPAWRESYLPLTTVLSCSLPFLSRIPFVPAGQEQPSRVEYPGWMGFDDLEHDIILPLTPRLAPV